MIAIYTPPPEPDRRIKIVKGTVVTFGDMELEIAEDSEIEIFFDNDE